jgi:hypothetical protein
MFLPPMLLYMISTYSQSLLKWYELIIVFPMILKQHPKALVFVFWTATKTSMIRRQEGNSKSYFKVLEEYFANLVFYEVTEFECALPCGLNLFPDYS